MFPILLMAEIRRAPVEVGGFSMFFPLLIGFQHHPRWLFGISVINSISTKWEDGRFTYMNGLNLWPM